MGTGAASNALKLGYQRSNSNSSPEHGGHELEAGREFCGPRGARDGDRAGFQRFAQDLQRGARPFRLELSKVRCCIHLITTDRR